MSSSPRRRKSSPLRRRNALAISSLHYGPNMTPMVDVVMVILVFFMASVAFYGREWFLSAAIQAPQGLARGASPVTDLQTPAVRVPIRLSRDAVGATTVTFLELRNAPIDAFLARLEGFRGQPATPTYEVIILPSPDVPMNDVVRVQSACYAVGMDKVAMGFSSDEARP